MASAIRLTAPYGRPQGKIYQYIAAMAESRATRYGGRRVYASVALAARLEQIEDRADQENRAGDFEFPRVACARIQMMSAIEMRGTIGAPGN